MHINHIEDAERLGCLVFHAGTRRIGDRVVSSGGRVLNVTAVGKTLTDARSQAYKGVHTVKFNHAQYRKDIGRKAILG
jgi:phosphoribosylamine--glycine ligase